jgi:hypothetical protein
MFRGGDPDGLSKFAGSLYLMMYTGREHLIQLGVG